MARPSSFKQATADIICERIANGESLRTICVDKAMPEKRTVLRWLAKAEYDEFRHQYASAREDQADSLFDEVLDIADAKDADVRRSQLRVDARKWMAGKLQPKKYGEKITQEITGTIDHRNRDAERFISGITSVAARTGTDETDPKSIH